MGTRWYTVVISILSVTGHFCRSSENQNNPHEQKIGSSREVSYRKKGSAENWATNTYITFGQRLWLCSAHILRIWMRLNSKVMDSLFWQRKLQVRVLSMQHHSYWLLLTPRITVIGHKKTGQKYMENVWFGRKRKTSSCRNKVGALRAEAVVSVFSMFGETPCMLLWDSWKGA